MNDLHITISYMSAPEIQRIGRELRRDPSDTQPGFYLRATRNEGYDDIVKYTRIPLAAMADLAEYIDEALPGDGAHIEIVVRNTISKHKLDAKRRRQAAETAIAQAEATLAALDAEEAGR